MDFIGGRVAECSICYNECDHNFCTTMCGHIFHKKCIDKWFYISLTCPICRSSPIAENDADSGAVVLDQTIQVDFYGVTVLLSQNWMERPRWNEMLVENEEGDFASHAYPTDQTLLLRKVLGRLDNNQNDQNGSCFTYSSQKFVDAIFPEDHTQRWIHMSVGDCSVVYRTISGNYVVEASLSINHLS